MSLILALLATASAGDACTGGTAILAKPLSGWSTPAPARGPVPLGRAFTLDLSLQPTTPGGGRTGYQGYAQVKIAEAGRYAVAASDRAWIDLSADGITTVKSAAHEHGPDCSGIRKIVMFDLQPGSYTVFFKSNPAPKLQALIARWDAP